MIPAEAVEAAVKARGCVWTPPKAKHPDCEECKEQARIILEAAAPHMLAAAWDAGHKLGQSAPFCPEPNPYRTPYAR